MRGFCAATKRRERLGTGKMNQWKVRVKAEGNLQLARFGIFN